MLSFDTSKKKKTSCWCIKHSVTFDWHMLLISVVEKNIMSCHLMHLGVLFLPGQYVYSNSVWFGAGLIFFFLRCFSLFYLGLCATHIKNHSGLSISFFFKFSPYSLNYNCFIWKNHFKLENRFQFYPHSISYLSNIVLILLILLFLFGMVYKFYLFLAISSSFFFFSCLVSIPFIAIFSISILQN
jgi:hypothetical protein